MVESGKAVRKSARVWLRRAAGVAPTAALGATVVVKGHERLADGRRGRGIARWISSASPSASRSPPSWGAHCAVWLVALGNIPVQLSPNVEEPEISVNTFCRSSPYEIERDIVEEQERVLKRIPGLYEMDSSSQNNRGRCR